MKKLDLEKRLKELGWHQVGGGKHDKWTNGILTYPVPRHKEINDFTAKAIIRFAQQNPPIRRSRNDPS